MSAFLDRERPQPYCRGCGHPHVLAALDDALARLGPPRERIALVTDIGCVGLADALFPSIHTVHTLHGRSVAVAAGLAMAAGAAGEPGREPLKPVVLVGDGGAGIGLLHLVHAAQLNVAVTVLVHDNLVYGMTGGQHSLLTPAGLRTTTTPEGCPTEPLDLGGVLSHAGFFARAVAPGEDLVGTLAEALAHPGFACVEILELCPTFAAARGGLTGKDLRAIPLERGWTLGVARRDARRPVFPGKRPAPAAPSPPPLPPGVVPERGWGRLDRTARLVVAGRAGELVQSAVLLAAQAACAAGLHATVRTDNPVTQGSGFSAAELVVAPEPVAYTGLVAPDLVIATAPEGRAELAGRGLLSPAAGVRRFVFDAELPAPEGLAAERRDLRSRFGPKGAALGALVVEIGAAGWWDPRAWGAVRETLDGERRRDFDAVLARCPAPSADRAG